MGFIGRCLRLIFIFRTLCELRLGMIELDLVLDQVIWCGANALAVNPFIESKKGGLNSADGLCDFRVGFPFAYW